MNRPFPFESLRDYVAVLEARGLLLRFRGVNQDAYEATAIMYALIDEFGMHEAPAVLFEDLRANGRVYPGPVVANTQGHTDTEARTRAHRIARPPARPSSTPRASGRRRVGRPSTRSLIARCWRERSPV